MKHFFAIGITMTFNLDEEPCIEGVHFFKDRPVTEKQLAEIRELVNRELDRQKENLVK